MSDGVLPSPLRPASAGLFLFPRFDWQRASPLSEPSR